MNETLTHTAPLTRWQGEKATYHLVKFTGDAAEALSEHALMQRLEFGRQRGFGSVKVIARIGDTEWKTSVFPQKENTPSHNKADGLQKSWILLVGKKVMRAEDLAEGDAVSLTLALL